MEEGEILGPVSMLFTAPLNLKTFQGLIYCHFMYPSFPLTSSSKSLRFLVAQFSRSHTIHAFVSQYSISMC